jgi:hypothetical protein
MLRDVYLYLYRRLTEGYTPREAEASVPSREDDKSVRSRVRAQYEEAIREYPGVQNASDMIAQLEAEAASHGEEPAPPEVRQPTGRGTQ